MIKKRLILFFIFIIACSSCYYLYIPSSLQTSIIPLRSYDDIDIHPDENTLITFDIDNTLLTAQDSSSLNYDMPLLFKILAVLRYPSLIINYEDVSSRIFAESPRKLTEQNVVNLINQYKKECPVIGLTGIESESYGTIPSMPKWRYTMLKSMGISFSKFHNQTFDQFPMYRYAYPRLYKGFICTNQQPKGKVLGTFIDKLKKKPTSIISFDDQIEALYSIAQACQKRNIVFTGYHYIGVSLQAQPFNYMHAFAQLGALMQDRTWISA